MSNSNILMAEFLKTKRTATRRIAIASPLCLALMAIVQQGYFSLNLFNWYYVVFLPATFALISATAVNIDNGKHGLRAIRCLPVSQGKIWSSKLLVVLGYALLSCFLLSVAVVCIPFIFSLFGINQIKQLSIASIFLGIIVMFITTMWQIPFSFIISKKLGVIFSVVVNLAISFSGVFLALKPYWMFCPWAWVNRSMISILGLLPNGLPVEEDLIYTQSYDVLIAIVTSVVLTMVLSSVSTTLYKKSEAR